MDSWSEACYLVTVFNRNNRNNRKWYLLTILFISCSAKAYPEFIGYGYAACLTCHYNGNGGGQLTDYGRALWSAEIASRALYPRSMTDEEMGAQSGFLGAVDLPYWLRPHVAYRGLLLRMNPGSASSDKMNYYQMQTDFGLAVQSKSAKYAAVATFGRVLPASEFGLGKQGLDHIMAKELYLRVEVVKTWWVYGGLIEKVFGLRNVDHTSYQRTYQGFNVQNDIADGIAESTGVIVQKVEKTWDASANAFFGNPGDSPDYQQAGGSLMGEFEVGENKRLGASLYSAQSHKLNKQMAAVHYRQALSKGSAVMGEWGLIQDAPQTGNTAVGSYNLAQAIILLTRGYNLKTTVERYNHDFASPDQWKTSFGFLMFPMPRLEIRAEAVKFTSQSTPDDSWALEGQVHVSL